MEGREWEAERLRLSNNHQEAKVNSAQRGKKGDKLKRYGDGEGEVTVFMTWVISLPGSALAGMGVCEWVRESQSERERETHTHTLTQTDMPHWGPGPWDGQDHVLQERQSPIRKANEIRVGVSAPSLLAYFQTNTLTHTTKRER